RLHRDARHYDAAESFYSTAIEIIEQLRRTADVVELRPWVLARRTLPYDELLALLIDLGRGVDALAVAESLHARTWLDVVLARGTGDAVPAVQALSAARIRKRLSADPTPALKPPTLMALVGDREV